MFWGHNGTTKLTWMLNNCCLLLIAHFQLLVGRLLRNHIHFVENLGERQILKLENNCSFMPDLVKKLCLSLLTLKGFLKIIYEEAV